MGIDTRWTKSGNMIFDDNAEIVGVIKDDVIEFDSSKIGGGGGIDPEIEEKIAGLCEYSTEETDTGKEWIDGKRIFRKCYEVTSPTTLNRLPFNENDNIVDMTGICEFVYAGKRYLYHLGYDDDSSRHFRVRGYGNELEVYVGSTFIESNTKIHLIVEYTKGD